jgi:hypothetical protein
MKGVFVLLLTICSLIFGLLPVQAAPSAGMAQSVAPSPSLAVPLAAVEQATQVDVQVAQTRVYHDPAGRFSVPVPSHWTANADYVALASPQEQITVYILALPGHNVAAAIERAWQRVDPDFALPPVQVKETPPLGSLEQILSVLYDSGEESGKLVMALGQLYDGVVYIGLVRGELVAFQQRAAQVRVIQSGFTIMSMREVNLVGVPPLRVDAAIIAELEAYITTAMTRFQIPGVAVSIVQDDQLVYAQGFGVRQAGQPEPVTPATLMLIGSATKSMTTMMMASLVEDGLLT